ncbi:MAG TPA: hypothetical protein VFC19_44965 [Candidatus Limnocylindrales bacterium]|nr:hypothetical protein [Candidatus Limnocylindrales bacterium]
MTTVNVTIEIDTDKLGSLTDKYLALLWHVAQANPAPLGDYFAGEAVLKIGREIIGRWLQQVPPQLWTHQECHHYWRELTRFASYQPAGQAGTDDFHPGQWHLDPGKLTKLADRSSLS